MPRAYAECCCGPTVSRPGVPFWGHLPTREEYIARLKEHLKTLQAEAKAVEERITELESAS
jgi:hypothetical protein